MDKDSLAVAKISIHEFIWKILHLVRRLPDNKINIIASRVLRDFQMFSLAPTGKKDPVRATAAPEDDIDIHA